MKRCYFDCETTGPDASKDRIVELAILLIDDNGKTLLRKAKRYNPGMPISPRATEVHGISDDDVKDCPTFEEDAKKLKKIFEDSVLIVYNGMQFDIPLLVNEFERARVDLDLSGEVIDVMRLETALNPRTLSAVYKRYSGEELEGAHSGADDVDATAYVLEAQLARIDAEKLDAKELLAGAGVPEGSADFFGKLKFLDNGALAFNFGKHKDQPILKNNETKQYANWILTQNFPTQVKKLLQDELKKDVAANFKKKPVAEKGFYQMRKESKPSTTLFDNTGAEDDLLF